MTVYHNGDLGIVVLTNDICRENPNREWRNDNLALMRLDAAVLEYYKQISKGIHPKIDISGGHVRGKRYPSLADVGFELIADYGVARSDVILNHALDTYENVAYSRGDMVKDNIVNAVIITNRFHQNRTQYFCEMFGNGIDFTVKTAEDILLEHFPDLERDIADFEKLPEVQERARREMKNLFLLRNVPFFNLMLRAYVHLEMAINGERKGIPAGPEIYAFRDAERIRRRIVELRTA
jgi:vancomycin permeability regulator SanA